ncbi:hypothetical protein K438DRAFT_1797272 [Mycena galopus ATCC 62051]|nr:hypothetical protein K438DRAFT_1797272 [Mycena galopus ATCC 62051]
MVQLSDTDFLKTMIYSRTNIALVAKFAYHVLELFYAVPVFNWKIATVSSATGIWRSPGTVVYISACTSCYFLGPGVPKGDRAV